jgi:hypothetical protein
MPKMEVLWRNVFLILSEHWRDWRMSEANDPEDPDAVLAHVHQDDVQKLQMKP